METKEKTKDICILCGTETDYTTETHVDQRVGYVDGAGQLCIDCWLEFSRVEKIS